MAERVDEKEFVCIICPNSCRLKVWYDPATEDVKVEGNKCPRGEAYGKQEYINPKRMLITTMRILGAKYPVIPVHSDGEIPKNMIFNAMQIVNDSYCRAPVKMGDILIENILETGINVVASRDMEKVKEEVPEVKTIADEIIEILRESFFAGKKILQREEQKLLYQTRDKIVDVLHKRYPIF